RADFLAGGGHPDDDALAPSTVAALERLAHDLGVADELETVVRAAARQLDQVRHQITLDVFGIDEVRQPEFSGEFLAGRIGVDADDHVGARKLCPLHHIEANPSEAKHHDVCTGLDFGRKNDRAYAGGNSAADVASLVEG